MTQASTQQHDVQLPVDEFRAGAVKATVWENQVDRERETVIIHNVTITRSYKDRENNWQETTSFDLQSLADLIDVADAIRQHYRVHRRDPRARATTLPHTSKAEIPSDATAEAPAATEETPI